MTLVAAALAVLVGAMAQSVAGLGFALVSGPLLVALLGASVGVAAAVSLSTVLNVVLLAREWRAVRWRSAALLLVPAAVMTPVWVFVVRHASDRLAAALAGAVTLAGVAAVGSGVRVRAARGSAGAVAAGVVSSAMNAVAAIGGPAAMLYAANAGWSVVATRATLQAYFLGLNVVTLAILGVHLPSPVLLGALAVGAAAGSVVAGRVPAVTARRLTLALAAAGALAVLTRAALSPP
jgi:uncharacterized membrane protein YfcA